MLKWLKSWMRDAYYDGTIYQGMPAHHADMQNQQELAREFACTRNLVFDAWVAAEKASKAERALDAAWERGNI